MVFLVVKGTTFPDEFIVECSTEDSLDTIPLDIPTPAPLTKEEIGELEKKNIPIKPPAQIALEHRRALNDPVRLLNVPHQGLAPLLTHLLNLRHYLRLMLLSAGELEQEVTLQRGIFHPPSQREETQPSSTGTRRQTPFSSSGVEARTPGRVAIYRTFVEETYALLKDKTKVMTKADFLKEIETRIHILRAYTMFLFPEWMLPPLSSSSESHSLSSEKAEENKGNVWVNAPSITNTSNPLHTTDVNDGATSGTPAPAEEKPECKSKEQMATTLSIRKTVTASGVIGEELIEPSCSGEEGKGSTSTSTSSAVDACKNADEFPFPLHFPWPKEQMEHVLSSLYAAHENPELNEEERLVVYHCRLILDDFWREEEREWAGETGVWFSGKLMTGKVGKYGLAKSKFIVRVAPRKGPPPSGEPRIRYEDQRSIFQKIREKRETFRHLEESELRDRVVQKSRGQVRWTGSGSRHPEWSNSGGIHLEEDAVRSNIGQRFRPKEVRDITE